MERLLYLFILFFPLGLNAQTFIENGVYYSIIFGTDNVKVTTSNSTSFYKGDIVIPETVEYNNKIYTVVSIGSGAFTGSEGLTSVTLPQTITSIGDSSFGGCLGLTNFVIPENVTSIGESAFYGSKNIKEITIPKSVKIICSRAFSGLEKLVLEDGEEPLQLVTLYSINDNTPFHICPLESIYLGRNLEYTSQYAPFRDNAKLTNLIIGEGVTEIGSCLFKDCSGLSEVVLGANVITIGRQAFMNCNALNNVLCYAINVPTTYVGAFSDSSINEATLFVPKVSIEQYRAITPWCDFGKIVSLDGESAIRTIQFENKNNDYYSLNGIIIDNPHHGIIIERTPKGETRKIYLKK